jgi:HK97 family phage portal protein
MKMLANNAVYPENSTEFYLNSYCGNNDVFTVINKITEPASTVPIFQYDKNGEVVENGKMLARLNNPNGYQSRSQFIEAALTFYYIFGESFTAFETIDNGMNKGVPLRLDTLPPQWVQLILGTYFNPVVGYSFYPMSGHNNSVPDYPKEKVFHWKEFNPDYQLTGGHLRGMSRLRPLVKTITGSAEAYNSLVKAFQSQGMWGILTLLEPDTNRAIETTKEQKSILKRTFKRDSKKGELTVANFGTQYTKMGLTIVELEVIKSIGLLGGKLTDAFNVPDQLFAGSQSKTYSNYKEAEQALWRNAIQTSLDAYLEGLSKWLAPFFPGEEETVLKADYSEVACLQNNMVELVQWMVSAQSFSRNDIREAVGWERLDIPGMDDILVSAGLMPISEMGLAPEQAEEVLKSLKISDYRKCR